MNSRSLQETKQLWKLYHPPIVEPNNNNSNNNNKRSKKSNYYNKLYQEFPTFNDFFKQQMRKDRYTSGEMKMLKSVYEYDISIGRTITTLNKYLEKIERFITENMNSFGLLGHQISVEKAVIWSALQYKKNIIQYIMFACSSICNNSCFSNSSVSYCLPPRDLRGCFKKEYSY